MEPNNTACSSVQAPLFGKEPPTSATEYRKREQLFSCRKGLLPFYADSVIETFPLKVGTNTDLLTKKKSGLKADVFSPDFQLT